MKGTSDVCLKFGIDDNGLIGYCDSNFASDLDRRKSTLGMVFTLGGTTISWMSSLQEVTTLSTAKAEYIAATESFKEAKWLKGLIRELCLRLSLICVHCDS